MTKSDAYSGTKQVRQASNGVTFYKTPITKTTKNGRKLKVYGAIDYLISPSSKRKQ